MGNEMKLCPFNDEDYVGPIPEMDDAPCPVCGGVGSAKDVAGVCVHQPRPDFGRSNAEISRLTEEVERLRAVLIEAGNAAGALISPTASVHVLADVPEQVRRLVASLRARAEAAEAEAERLREQLGQTRMCVNCGKTVNAEKVKRGDDLPECVGPEGLSACTFNLTPEEAWQHWRGVAHQLRGDVARLAKDLRAARNAALDEAARFVEEHNILHTSAGDVLEPRREGNRSGLAFASGIRSLKTEEPPQ